MRWSDDRGEVAVLGVNYYAPFALEYERLRKLGRDVKATISGDVAHFRRMGLTAVRLHCFDREMSTHVGGFVDNDYVDALDWLISECASNGIYSVLTPIAGWGGYGTNGFSCSHDIREITSDLGLRKAAVRFEREFAEHVNRYTGRRYADDPCVLCFELINEPEYPPGSTGEQIAEFANALLDGIRRSGTKKPVFYSATWNRRYDCMPKLRTDGVSGVYYPTGLRAGHTLPFLQLSRVKKSSLACDSGLSGKAKMIYEFDAADTPGAYMYPAMARLFRSEGVQSATQFQYDPTPLAGNNASFRTHYLNLVYTPAKAMSLALAAEVFRRLPRGVPFSSARNEMTFPPFRINADANLSEMLTEADFIYTATTQTKIHEPEKLRRVWGCGSSQVAGSTGTGCYFLDRAADGVWRLQLYPSVMPCADPHEGGAWKKTVVLPDSPELTVRLPDLGVAFSVWRMKDGSSAGAAREGRIVIAPGDYVLACGASLSTAQHEAAKAVDVPRWWAPPPDKPDPNRRKWPRSVSELAAEGRATCHAPSDWNFFDVPRAVQCGVHGGKASSVPVKPNLHACRYQFADFMKMKSVSMSVPSDGKVYAAAFPEAGPGRELIITARAVSNEEERVEVALRLDNGQVWGTNVTMGRRWRDVRIPFSDIRYFSHWEDVPKRQKDFLLDIRRLNMIHLCAGRWLDPSAAGRAHAFEIASVRVE